MMLNFAHCGQGNACDRAILSPDLVQRLVQFNHFRATCFDYRLHFNITSNHIYLTAVMHSNDEHKKLALDGFMTQFFSQLLYQVRKFRDPTSCILQPRDNDIMHLYLDNFSYFGVEDVVEHHDCSCCV